LVFSAKKPSSLTFIPHKPSSHLLLDYDFTLSFSFNNSIMQFHKTPKKKTRPLPAFVGPYTVGIANVEIPIAELPTDVTSTLDRTIPTVHFAIYYPCKTPSTEQEQNDAQQDPIYWVPRPRKANVQALSQFMGFSPKLATIFSYVEQSLSLGIF
jgi:hypothetical protein